MGNVTFVSGSQFPNYGDGNISGFTIGIVQNCLPSSLYVRIEGGYGDYDWNVTELGGDSVCNGTITHDGSGSGADSNEYITCEGAPIVVGQQYELTVFNDDGTERLTFDAIDCGVLYPLQVSYNCSTGLEIICEGVCTSADIVKVEDATETVALPLASPVFLEGGFYNIEVGDNSVEIFVDCDVTLSTSYSTCNEPGVPNITLVLDNVITSEEYTITLETVEEIPVVVYEATLIVDGIPPEIGTALNSVGVIINEFDTPPIDETTDYTITIEHTSLNAKSYLGTFNAPIVDVTDTVSTADCTTDTFIGFDIDVAVTNVTCSDVGFSFDVEALNDTNITQIDYTIADSNEVGVYFERETYIGTNNKRTITIPYSAFGGCVNLDFIVFFTVKGIDGSDITWYNLRLDSDLISASLEDCSWAETCLLIA